MEKFKLRYLLRAVIALLFLMAGCASQDKEFTFARTTFSFDHEMQPFDVFTEYRISPGDILDVLFQIQTWVEKKNFKLGVDHLVSVSFVHSPELNVEQTVRPDGKITLPYVGEVYVVGKTIEEITRDLKKDFSTILQSPDIYVMVPEFNSAIKELKKDLHTAPRGLSRLSTVRPDGYATFPMLGDVKVAGRTIPGVNDTLNSKYEKMIEGLHCDLFLEKKSGSSIYLVGEVKRPGGYNIHRPTTVMEALALAGSYLPSARLSNIIVVRKYEGKMVAKCIDLSDSFGLKKNSSFFYLLPNDIVYVPKGRIARAAEIASYISSIAFFRGWGASVGLNYTYQLHREPSTYDYEDEDLD